MQNIDCNGEVGERSAVLDGATNPDWFYYYGQWSFVNCGDGDATPSVTFTEGDDLPFCLLAVCANDLDTTVVCTAGDPGQDSDVCCGTGVVSMSVNCVSTADEEATIDIIIDAPDAVCRSYTFEYEY